MVSPSTTGVFEEAHTHASSAVTPSAFNQSVLLTHYSLINGHALQPRHREFGADAERGASRAPVKKACSSTADSSFSLRWNADGRGESDSACCQGMFGKAHGSKT